MHELGSIDMLHGRPADRLEQARRLSLAQGALATAAVVDVQIAAALVFEDDPSVALPAVRSSAELARRYGLEQTLATALAFAAYVHARNRQRAEMQECIDEALAVSDNAPDVELKTSTAAALFALVDEDRASAVRHLEDAARRVASGSGVLAPAVGFLALLAQLDPTETITSALDAHAKAHHFMTSAYFRYADAVVLGRRGDTDGAAARVAEADSLLAGHRWFRHLGRRFVAEAAIADGWGDPVSWLREALDWFAARTDEQLASACRSLLRKAGAPVPRRRGEGDVPAELRALGVTARELEVLQLVGRGLPNKDIAGRLYLSQRTVERHVANLADKTGVTRRSELVAYAARILPGAAESG